MSPVEIFGTARCAAMNSAWVPLPAPGGPTSTSRIMAPRRPEDLREHRRGVRSSAQDARPLAQEPFIVALHELALDLLDGLQSDANHDQHSRPAEGEVLVLLAVQPDEEEVRQDR